jgi:hypothetical protein
VIDFKRQGWPPSEEDAERLRDYARREQLYESDHMTAFAEKSARLPSHLSVKKYLIQDYPKLITDVFGHLLAGEAPLFSHEQQAEIDKLVRDNQLPLMLLEAVKSCSIRGDGVIRLRVGKSWDGTPAVLIEEVPAYHYFVEMDPHNLRVILSQCLAWEHCCSDKDGNPIRYLVVEHHEPGRIVNELFEIDVRDNCNPVPLSRLFPDKQPVEETRVPMPLLVHIPNERHGSCYWGKSDYTAGLESLFDEANQRLTEIANILDKHADPKLITSMGSVLDKRGNVRSNNLQVIEVTPDEAQAGLPRLLTWDAQLTGAFQELEKIAALIFKFAKISPAYFGEDKAGSIESGRAMLFRFMATLARVKEKRLYWDGGLERIFYIAQLLSQAWLSGPAPVGFVETSWRSGLPKDVKELTEVAVAQIGAGIMSKHTGIRFANQVGDPEAEAELARIDAEATNEPDPPAGSDDIADPTGQDDTPDTSPAAE